MSRPKVSERIADARERGLRAGYAAGYRAALGACHERGLALEDSAAVYFQLMEIRKWCSLRIESAPPGLDHYQWQELVEFES